MRINKKRCPFCGEPHWIHYWINRNCADSDNGLAVGDFDLTFHRFKWIVDGRGERGIEYMMIVEVKTGREELRPAQRDTLSTFNGLLDLIMPVDGSPVGVKSRPGMITKGKKVIFFGVHLLRVPFEENERGPFWWDNKPVARETLIGILNFEIDPWRITRKLDIERRHKRKLLLPEKLQFDY